MGLYGVALATLNDDPCVGPDPHAFIIDKAPWFAVTDNLPQYPVRIPGQNTAQFLAGPIDVIARRGG